MVGETVVVTLPAKATRPIATSSGALSRKALIAVVAASNLPCPFMLLLASRTITVDRSMSPASTSFDDDSTAEPLSSTKTCAGSTVVPSGRPSVDRSRLTVPRSVSTWSMLISSSANAGAPAAGRARTSPSAPASQRAADAHRAPPTVNTAGLRCTPWSARRSRNRGRRPVDSRPPLNLPCSFMPAE